jgi:hypothetical protein
MKKYEDRLNEAAEKFLAKDADRYYWFLFEQAFEAGWQAHIDFQNEAHNLQYEQAMETLRNL